MTDPAKKEPPPKHYSPNMTPMQELEWRRHHKYPNMLYLVDSTRFELFIAGVIMFNCVTIGVQTNAQGDTMFVIALCEQFFTFVFLVEYVMRSLVFGAYNTIFGSVYKFADFFLVIFTGVMISWILAPMDAIEGFWRNLQVLRVLRLVRMIRVVRNIPFFRQVWLIVQGLAESVRLIFWSSVVGIFCLFLFGVFTTELIGNQTESGAPDELRVGMFGSVSASMMTLLQIFLLDRAFDVINEVKLYHPGMELFFMLVIVIGNFLLLNLITAVIIEHSLALVKDDDENKREHMKKELERKTQDLTLLFSDIADGQPVISMAAFRKFATKDANKATLDRLNIMVGEFEELFEIIDVDRGGTLELDEFLNGMLTLKSPAEARRALSLTTKLRQLERLLGHEVERLDTQDDLLAILEDKAAECLVMCSRITGVLPLRLAAQPSLAPKRPVKKPRPIVDPDVDDAVVAVEGVHPDRRGAAQERDEALDVDPVTIAQLKYALVETALRSVQIAFPPESSMLGGHDRGNQKVVRADFVRIMQACSVSPEDAKAAWRILGLRDDQVLDLQLFAHQLAVEAEAPEYRDAVFVPVRAALFACATGDALGRIGAKGTPSVDRLLFGNLTAELRLTPREAEMLWRYFVGPLGKQLGIAEMCRKLSFDMTGYAPHLLANVRNTLLLQAFRRHVCEMKIEVGYEQFVERMAAIGLSDELGRHVYKLLDTNGRKQLNSAEFIHAVILHSAEPLFVQLQSKLLEYVFSFIDADGSQDLDPEEFTERLTPLGLSWQECRRVFAWMDLNHNNRLTATEFLHALESKKKMTGETLQIKYAVLIAAFQQFDQDNSAWLTPVEFLAALRGFGVHATDAMKVFQMIDADNDGMLSVSEFCRAMAAKGNSELFVRVKWGVLRTAFDVFCSNEKGRGVTMASALPKPQFVSALMRFGGQEADAMMLFDRMDRNKDGVVDLMEFCHAMAVDGTHAADPRILMILKYELLKAIWYSLDQNADNVLDPQEFVVAIVRLGGSRESARKVFSQLAQQQGTGPEKLVTRNAFCHAFATGSGGLFKQSHFLAIKETLYGSLPKILQVKQNEMLDSTAWVSALHRIGVDASQARSAFVMLDVEHKGVLIFDTVLRALST